MGTAESTQSSLAARAPILPLALAQFVCSFAGTSTNVAITPIAKDLGTTVSGVQTAITVFTLTMAALMIPGSKLTDILGRKRCFVLGLSVYGAGALLTSLAQGLPAMITGYSLLEGIGSALLIPPVYILVTVSHRDVRSRAKFFGIVSGAGGLGAAAGPLVGGLITSSISWRATFGLQLVLVLLIVWLARSITDTPVARPRPTFDVEGAVLSAAGLVLVVIGLLETRTYGWFVSRADFSIGGVVILPKGSMSPVWLYFAAGAVFLVWFLGHLRRRERRGRAVLVSLRMFSRRAANLGMATQFAQWMSMQGCFFVVSVYLQQVRHFDAITTGLILTPATAGILAASAAAQRLASRRTQRTLIIAGFVLASLGMALLLVLVRPHNDILLTVPGTLAFGLGVGVMLTASVNLVQSAFPARDQGEISGLSRSVSNLGSTFGTAMAGSVLVAAGIHLKDGRDFGAALLVLLIFTLLGLAAAVFLPRERAATGAAALTPIE